MAACNDETDAFIGLTSKIADRQQAQKENLEAYKAEIAKRVAQVADPTPEQRAENVRKFHERQHAYAVRQEQEFQARQMAHWARVQNQIGPRYARCRLDNFAMYEDRESAKRQFFMLERVKDFCANMSDNIKAGANMILFGPKGTGKDHILAACMHVAALECQQSVHWVNGLDFYGGVRDLIGSGEKESSFIERFVRPDVLAISDPVPPSGETLKDFQQQMLFRIVDERYRQTGPIWITVNAEGRDDLERRMGGNIADRLIHSSLSLFFDWPTYRRPL